jgi:hypothetical protein
VGGASSAAGNVGSGAADLSDLNDAGVLEQPNRAHTHAVER